MAFVEHNNRAKAKKLAEFITGKPLRQYLADKVKKYVGCSPSVFDGAAGSGQLEQFINPSRFVAVEIQSESCEALKTNYPKAQIHNMSFFNYPTAQESLCDCVVMNPPFSLTFKGLAENEKKAIQEEFHWKNKGNVDDIFVLKGLNQSKRWGFFILSSGMAYRSTEAIFREKLGCQLVELNLIQNAFEDTSISVLFLVIDKQKTSQNVIRELIDFKQNTPLVASDEWLINHEKWETVSPPKEEVEEIEFSDMEALSKNAFRERIKSELTLSKMFVDLSIASNIPFSMNSKSEFNQFCDDICNDVKAFKYTGM
ncbi:SAM-dependent methyltransferase [Gallibacterium salpingitidis]|uniref:N-6 DNA methylase n=1 Tax=Gallibacterium salpingitidis TaxID=505341 RepID=UPI0026702282|nr:N-6 DNA methylase [Gallibacterium salpingitidis]WKS98511.1 SAM-dependent methyltransferase [Gallibacterium salpingitidis]